MVLLGCFVALQLGERDNIDSERPPGFSKAGDRASASTFIRLTQRDLRRFLTYVADPRDVEDLSQETYLRAMRALVQFDGRSSAKTWLFAIARRVAADHVRLAMRRPRLVAMDTWDETAAGHHHAGAPLLDEAHAVRDLLQGLDPERREAFALTQVLGPTYSEAAEICGCPVGTIRSRVSRARDELIIATQSTKSDRPRSTAT